MAYSFILPASALVLVLSALLFFAYVVFGSQKVSPRVLDHLLEYCTFFYSSFLKPHSKDTGSDQQAALESFYKVQVACTETRLLQSLLGLI